jgi:membrane peptidoglycan carboxypeptidase
VTEGALPYPRTVPPTSPTEGLVSKTVLFLGLSMLAGVLVAGLALPAVGLLGLTAKRGAENFQSLPAALKVPPLKQRSKLLSADGTLLATFYSQNRVYVPLDKVSQEMQDAIVAIEDARFYEHSGIDLRGTIRAVLANSQAGTVTQGGSTLTQQYVKNVLQTTADTKAEREAAAEDSVSRKIRELRYALGLEQRWSKERILEGYLNIAYFGSQAYGVEVAAQRYFSKPAAKLNAGEAATIAGIVKYPSLYDPLVNPRKAEVRRDIVLQRMADLDMITQEDADKAQARELTDTLDPSELTRGCAVSKVPFFCIYVQRSILADPAFGKTVADRRALLNGGGLTIRTTLDMTAQRAAQKAVENYIPTGDPSGRVAAIAMIEPGTGNIMAMAQNLDYGKGSGKSYINNAVDEPFAGTNGQQAGSTFKAFTLGAAIEAGLPITEQISSPSSRVFPYGSFENCDGAPLEEWRMENYNGSPAGSFDMRTGAAYSVNTYFAELQRRVGLCNVIDLASRAGISDANGTDPMKDTTLQQQAFTLGAAFEISPLTLAEGYATFAARGVHCEPRSVARVTTRDDTDVPVTPPDCEQVMDADVADAVNSILSGVIDGNITGRTGAEMSLGRPAAGKTGTSDANAAVWFAGYTPDLAAAVWAGHPDAPNDFPMRAVTINGTYYPFVYGRSIPGPIWREAMLGALADVPPSSFTPLDPELLDGDSITLPSVVGLKEAEAVKRLEQLGLTVTVAPDQVASAQAQGLVAYTNPGAGSSVAPRTPVTIYLSNGVPPEPSPSPSDNSGSPQQSEGGGNAKPNKPDKPDKPKPGKPGKPDNPGGGGGQSD